MKWSIFVFKEIAIKFFQFPNLVVVGFTAHLKIVFCFIGLQLSGPLNFWWITVILLVESRSFDKLLVYRRALTPLHSWQTYFYHYESKWLKELKKTNLLKARKFSNTFRFIDDLNAMNDGGLFEQHFKEIYPPELELKKEHGNANASFLDLDITVKDSQFDIRLYDKRDAFPFKIVKMPHRESNMPSRIFYSSFGAEVLRIVRTSTESKSFFESSKRLLHRMVRQGANKERIVRTLKQNYGRHDVLKQFESNASLFARTFFE